MLFFCFLKILQTSNKRQWSITLRTICSTKRIKEFNKMDVTYAFSQTTDNLNAKLDPNRG